MFTDHITIKFTAGKGGNGVVAWRREKFIPKGGPCGGNGGRGGAIILKSDPEIYSLDAFKNKKANKAVKKGIAAKHNKVIAAVVFVIEYINEIIATPSPQPPINPDLPIPQTINRPLHSIICFTTASNFSSILFSSTATASDSIRITSLAISMTFLLFIYENLILITERPR